MVACLQDFLQRAISAGFPSSCQISRISFSAPNRLVVGWTCICSCHSCYSAATIPPYDLDSLPLPCESWVLLLTMLLQTCSNPGGACTALRFRWHTPLWSPAAEAPVCCSWTTSLFFQQQQNCHSCSSDPDLDIVAWKSLFVVVVALAVFLVMSLNIADHCSVCFD